MATYWRRTQHAFDRKKHYQLLQVGKTELGWDEEFYRGIWLPQQGASKDAKGFYSATTLSDAQLAAALQIMRNLGFKPKPGKNKDGKPASKRPLADDAQSRKIRQLWLEMHEQKIVRDPSERSLNAYVKRITKVEALQWLDTQQASTVIEALKSWQKRMTKPPAA